MMKMRNKKRLERTHIEPSKKFVLSDYDLDRINLLVQSFIEAMIKVRATSLEGEFIENKT